MKALNEKILQALPESEWQVQNMKDSQSHQTSQIIDLYSIFRVPQYQEEPTDLEKSIESMSQSQNDYVQSQNNSFNRLEAHIGHLINTINDRNEETLPTNFWPFTFS